jgi:5'-nucleotidase
MNRLPAFLVACLALLFLPPSLPAAPVEIVLLHLNDVYEITRPKKTDLGGLTRVAGLLQQLKAKNPNTVSILAGDFLSPSALGTAKLDDGRLDGRHMVEVLNSLPLDLAMFGNHEFDIPEAAFRDRLKEARFGWFAGNTTDAKGQPFPGVEPYKILTFKKDDTEVRLGLIALTIETGKNRKDRYWKQENYLEVAKRQVPELRNKHKVDLLVAITHQDLADDQKLAREVPGIDLILGGHEHENNTWRSRTPGVPAICKADANVRTVFVHHLNFDPATKNLDIESQLLAVTNAYPEEPETVKVVEKWVETGFLALQRSSGIDPKEVVVTTTDDLEGRESMVRTRATNLTSLVGQAILRTAEDADLAVYNSGMIRIDDILPAGPLTGYDVLRILPFGGKVLAAEIQGSRLQKLLDKGLSSGLHTKGAFLQTANVARSEDGRWTIRGKPLDPARVYKMVGGDYLLAGREEPLPFFQPGPEFKLLDSTGDLQSALMRELKRVYGEPKKAEGDKPGTAAVIPTRKRAPIAWEPVIGISLGVAGLLGMLYLGWRCMRTG